MDVAGFSIRYGFGEKEENTLKDKTHQVSLGGNLHETIECVGEDLYITYYLSREENYSLTLNSFLDNLR